MRLSRRTLIASLGSGAILPKAALAQPVAQTRHPRGIDWATFLSRHDLIWDRLPREWVEAPFLGNGMLGAMLYRDADSGRIRLDIGRADVQDHRSPNRNTGFDRARLPIGHFLLRTRGQLVDKARWRLVLHDATLVGELRTDRGRIHIRAYVHAHDMAIVVQTRATRGEAGFKWDWVGEEAFSPRQHWGLATNDPARIDRTYRGNPSGIRTRDGTEELWLQPLAAGGGTATAWRSTTGQLVVSVAHDSSGDDAARQALASVRATADDATCGARHEAWWRNYYPASFLSLPDTRIESFYWIQMYKLASATRGDRAYIDNQGPWLQPTAWPFATFNLNVQLSYWPMLTANRAALVGSLIAAIYANQDRLIANVPPAYRQDSSTIGRGAGSDLEAPVRAPDPSGAPWTSGSHVSLADGSAPELGNLPWALHDVWLAWRHTMDEHILRDTLFPVLRRAVNYYRHFLRPDAQGRLHLAPTYSPEYGSAPDLNYDLALLRWACAALIDADRRLGGGDALVPVWRDILDMLVDYPTGADGYLIGAGLPLSRSHRHYSHLMMAYPLYLVNREQAGAEAIVRRTLDHWQSMPAMLRGYSSTGAASICAAFSDGNGALRHLRDLLDTYVQPNTMYRESGPVIETPLSGAQTIHDMVLQSWGNVVRPFPAVPDSWPELVFDGLSAEGGFVVGARRVGGRTLWITVNSRAGEPFALETDIADPVAVVGTAPRTLTRDERGYWTCPLARGESVTIRPRGGTGAPTVSPLPAGVANSYGLNTRTILPSKRDNAVPTNPGASAGA